MKVLHSNDDAILTIVQVLLYDPLYVWTITPIRGYQLQHRHAAADGDATDVNLNLTTDDLIDPSESRTKRLFNNIYNINNSPTQPLRMPFQHLFQMIV